MAIYPGTEPILEAAADWKRRCLFEDGSMLTENDARWTPSLFDELIEHYVENPKVGKRHFLEKLEDQLEEASPEATCLMAELIWVLMLFPNNFRPATKRRKIRTVWEWTEEPLAESSYLQEPLEQGIGSVGPGFINHQDLELKYLITVVRDLKELGRDERGALLDDPWRWVSQLDSYGDLGSRQLSHILPHLLDPDTFERISSWNQKREILRKFGREEEAESDELVSLDRGLLDLRHDLEAEYPDRDHLDFYRPPLIERWQLEARPEFEFVEEELDWAREGFLGWLDGFSTFEEPGEEYVEGERGYKDVLRDRFLDLAESLPDLDDLTEERASRVVDEVLSLLSKTLDPYDWSQNLINWRYTNFLRELEEGEASVFTRSLIELLETDIPSPARVERFNQDIWPILENHDAATYAASRSLPTFFLWLHDPDREIYIRTSLFNSMGQRLVGEKIFRNKRLDMEEYQRALAFAHGVRDRLEQWGWKPEDMIDVQSFLWTAHTALEEAEEDEPKKGGSGKGENGDGPDDKFSSTRDLQDVLDMLEADGFHFPPDLVANYLLALQTKRFVILTGISGTGKTKLAMKVAEFFISDHGLEGSDPDPTDRTMVTAVRPDWTDPRGLIGYQNPITDEYVETDFLRLLLAARQEEADAKRENRPARPFFVVLDEMNLARVEHYFSDFLSCLESGRPLSLHHEDREDGSVPSRLRIPRNVFFTGTVNVDETTHMFSPKVLDRAFTLELNEVDLDGWALGDTDQPGWSKGLDLPRLEVPLRWYGQPGAEQWQEFGALLDGKPRETVTALNSALAPWGYHFGYRVAGEIASFVLLAHRQGAASSDAVWSALDMAVLEKVLPKFHGTEQELEPPLQTVSFVARHGRAPTDEESASLNGLAGAEQSDEAELHLPRCHEKVRRMLRRLRQSGFAAFIE